MMKNNNNNTATDIQSHMFTFIMTQGLVIQDSEIMKTSCSSLGNRSDQKLRRYLQVLQRQCVANMLDMLKNRRLLMLISFI